MDKTIIKFKSIDSLRYFVNVLDGFYADYGDQQGKTLAITFTESTMPGVKVETVPYVSV